MKTLSLFKQIIFSMFLAVTASATTAPLNQPELIYIQESTAFVEGGSNAEPIQLLNWSATGKVREIPAVPYQRKDLFGRWIQYKKTKGCFDVRAQVLIRESVIPATSTDAKPCTIEKGEWHDPYSGQILTSDDQVQIDHMVPLKEAYLAGAYAWSPAKRCVYANFLGMKDHLIAASNFENMSKSDQTPEGYIPPKKEYVCTYLKNWLTVKAIWKLSMTLTESEAIRRYVTEFACDPAEFSISRDFVSETRQTAQKAEATCPVTKPKVVRQ